MGLQVVIGPLHQCVAAFNAQHLTRLRGQWQRKVAQAAKPVDHTFVFLHIQEAQRAGDQHAVDLRVDLRKVGGFERHGDAKVGQRVGQDLLVRR